MTAYHLTNDPLYLDKAKDLADRILPVFDTPSQLPTSYINLAKREGVRDKDNNGLVSTAEVSTLQLEFRYLSYLTDNDAYWDAVERVRHVLLTSAFNAARMRIHSGKGTYVRRHIGYEDHQGISTDDGPGFDFHEVSQVPVPV